MKCTEINMNTLVLIVMLLVYSVRTCSMMPWQVIIKKEETEQVMCLSDSLLSSELSNYVLTLNLISNPKQLILCICTESDCPSSINSESLSELYDQASSKSKILFNEKIACNTEIYRHVDYYSSIFLPLSSTLLSSLSVANPLHIFIRNTPSNSSKYSPLEYILSLQSALTFCHSCVHSVSCDSVRLQCVCKPLYYGQYCQVLAAGQLTIHESSNSKTEANSVSQNLNFPQFQHSFVGIHTNTTEESNNSVAYILIQLNNSVDQTIKLVSSSSIFMNNYPSEVDPYLSLSVPPNHLVYLSVSKSKEVEETAIPPIILQDTHIYQFNNKKIVQIVNFTLSYMEFFIVMNSTETLNIQVSGSSLRDYLIQEDLQDSKDSLTNGAEISSLSIFLYVLFGILGVGLLCLLLVAQVNYERQNQKEAAAAAVKSSQHQQPFSTALHNNFTQNNENTEENKISNSNKNPDRNISIRDIKSSNELAQMNLPEQLSSQQTLFFNNLLARNHEQQHPFQRGQELNIIMEQSSHLIQMKGSQKSRIKRALPDNFQMKQSKQSPNLNQISNNLQKEQSPEGFDENNIQNGTNIFIPNYDVNSSELQEHSKPSPQFQFPETDYHTSNIYVPQITSAMFNNFSLPNQEPQTNLPQLYSMKFLDDWLNSMTLQQQQYNRPLVQTNNDLKLQSNLEPIIKDETESVEYCAPINNNHQDNSIPFSGSSIGSGNDAVQVPQPQWTLISAISMGSSVTSTSSYPSTKSLEQSIKVDSLQSNNNNNNSNIIQDNTEISFENQSALATATRREFFALDKISELHSSAMSGEEITRDNTNKLQNNQIISPSTAEKIAAEEKSNS